MRHRLAAFERFADALELREPIIDIVRRELGVGDPR